MTSRGRASRGSVTSLRAVTIGLAAIGTSIAVGAAGVLHAPVRPADTVVRAADAAQSAPAGAAPAAPGTATTGAATPGTAAPGTAARPSASGSPAGALVGANAPATFRGLPAVGPGTLAKIPRSATQLILVSGATATATTNTVTRWQRAAPSAPWTRVGAALTGHNGADGWTAAHRDGDLRTPDGVFTLTYAGGRLANPGTRLPYEQNASLYVAEGDFLGHSLAGAFDYLVDIDYNHPAGTPPSNHARPLGAALGGDIWLHVDHGAPTHGCVSLPEADLVTVMKWLDPAHHPVIVMGDAATLAG